MKKLKSLKSFILSAILLLICFGLCSCGKGSSEAFIELPDISESESSSQASQGLSQKLLDTRFPPVLKSITLTPSEPIAGSTTKITVKIYNNPATSNDVTSNVTLHYMKDFDGVWQSINLTTTDNMNWTGNFPAFNKDVEIVYSIRAVDTSENVFVTVSCKEYEITGYELFQTDFLNDCTKATSDLSSCTDTLPRGCFFKGSIDDNPINDADSLSPPDGDIADIRIGFGNENNMDIIYYDVAVQGEINVGSANPVDLHYYNGMMINPEKAGNTKNLSSILATKGAAYLVYNPLISLIPNEESCSFSYMDNNSTVQNTSLLNCRTKSDTNHIVFKIKIDDVANIIGDNPSDTYDFVAYTGTITDTDTLEGDYFDNTHFTSAKFDFNGEYYFQVK